VCVLKQLQAKTVRKTLGGGMRQVGALCAAAYVAVRDTVGKLAMTTGGLKRWQVSFVFL
jgi:hypothetical protein